MIFTFVIIIIVLSVFCKLAQNRTDPSEPAIVDGHALLGEHRNKVPMWFVENVAMSLMALKMERGDVAMMGRWLVVKARRAGVPLTAHFACVTLARRLAIFVEEEAALTLAHPSAMPQILQLTMIAGVSEHVGLLRAACLPWMSHLMSPRRPGTRPWSTLVPQRGLGYAKLPDAEKLVHLKFGMCRVKPFASSSRELLPPLTTALVATPSLDQDGIVQSLTTRVLGEVISPHPLATLPIPFQPVTYTFVHQDPDHHLSLENTFQQYRNVHEVNLIVYGPLVSPTSPPNLLDIEAVVAQQIMPGKKNIVLLRSEKSMDAAMSRVGAWRRVGRKWACDFLTPVCVPRLQRKQLQCMRERITVTTRRLDGVRVRLTMLRWFYTAVRPSWRVNPMTSAYNVFRLAHPWCPADLDPLEFEEWVKRYPAGYRQQLRDARSVMDTKNLVIGSDVNVENFVKNEAGHTLTDLRNISMRTKRCLAWVGPYVSAIEHHAKAACYLVKGLTPEKRDVYMNPLLGAYHYVENDMSRFDKHIHQTMLMTVERHFLLEPFDEERHWKYHDLIKKGESANSQSRHGTFFFKAGTRRSGDSCTSIANGTLNAFVAWALFEGTGYFEGDDMIMSTQQRDSSKLFSAAACYVLFGLVAKTKVQREVDGLTFCGRVLTESLGGLVSVADLLRTLAKFHVVCNDKSAEYALCAKAMSIAYVDSGTPLVGPLAVSIANALRKRLKPGKLVRYVQRNVRDLPWYMRDSGVRAEDIVACRSVSRVSTEKRWLVDLVWNIPPAQQRWIEGIYQLFEHGIPEWMPRLIVEWPDLFGVTFTRDVNRLVYL